MKVYEIPLKSFLELALLRIQPGEITGVFRKEHPNDLLMDVFLPNNDCEYCREWAGDMWVRDGVTVLDTLKEFHKKVVLSRFFNDALEFVERPQQGAKKFESKSLEHYVRAYRSRSRNEVVSEMSKAIKDAKALPRFRSSPVPHTLFDEKPDFRVGVKIRFTPALQQLELMSLLGETVTRTLTTKNAEDEILAICTEHLLYAGIALTDSTPAVPAVA